MKSLILFLIVAIASINAYCPNNCSPPNGDCSPADVCQCMAGWSGDDCSISDIGLANHVPVDSRVETRQWKFFHFFGRSQQSSIEFEVNQTGSGGDIDAYVRLDKYPSRQEYDMRDISTSKRMKFEIQSPEGVYYVGVYGFLGSDFTVMATLKTACPNDCSGHGSCSFDGVCTCRTGFVGEDCSQAVISLTPNNPVNGHVGKRKWKYYSFENSENTVNITLDTEGEDQDADLYVKFGSIPSMTNFDARDTTTSSHSTLRLSGAIVGTYYIGVFGFTDSADYSISFEAHSECPNQCSGEAHGACSDTFDCVCQPGYSGEICERRVAEIALDGTKYSGYVGGNIWNFFAFGTYTTNNIELSLRQLNDQADCDLYVRQGDEEPTKSRFDYRDISFRDNISLTIQNPGLAQWHVGIFGYKDCSYELSGSITLRCPNDCTDENHGTCIAGHCLCKDDWTSEDCSLKSVVMENGVEHSGVVQNGQWNYYRFQAVPGTRITIALKEDISIGNVWLFQSQGDHPTLSTFDLSETETNTNIHRIVAHVDESAEVKIGVYGSILATQGVDQPYHIVVWQARFD